MFGSKEISQKVLDFLDSFLIAKIANPVEYCLSSLYIGEIRHKITELDKIRYKNTEFGGINSVALNYCF